MKRAGAALFFVTVIAIQSAQAQTFSLIHTFTGGSDGATPFGSLLLFPHFAYGTTSGGGAYNAGTVFTVNTTTYQEMVIHSFAGGPHDGSAPFAGLISDRPGNIYGVTYNGGAHFRGTVFKIPVAGEYSVIHSFAGRSGKEGAGPAGNLVIGTQGRLYGTTYGGGNTSGWGTVFRIDAEGVFSTLQSFAPDGALPRAGLLLLKDSLYGTSSGAATRDFGGTLFQVGVIGALHVFTGGADGAQPLGGLIADQEGNLYGTTSGGGSGNFGLGNGVIFEFTPTGKQFIVLHTFSGSDGAVPTGTLALDSGGNLYGTTTLGGTYNYGTVFKLDPSGNLTTLYSFEGGNDGANPFAGVVLDNFGNLWGVASSGGSAGYGTVFEIIFGT